MKQVFSNIHQCLHVWASGSQQYGKAGSVFFDGDTVYSYGHHFPMARVYKTSTGERVALFNPAKYSVTTSKHQSMASNAWRGNGAMHHLPVKFWPCSGLIFEPGELQKLLDLYKVEYELQAVEVRERKREAAKRKREAAKLAKLSFPEQLAKWQNGEIRSLPGSSSWDSPVFLRIVGDTLETSKGARVPLSVAKNAWVKLRTGDLAIGERVGPFTVDSIEGDNLKVGCHLFSIRAINQFFTSILP